MEYQEFNNCYEILQRKPFFFQKDDIQQKLECLETFKAKGKPQNIVFLFDLLTNTNPLLRNGAMDTISALFQKIKSQTEFYTSLKYTSIEQNDLDFFRTTFSADNYLYLIAIATLNKNGFIREQAVKELAETRNPEAIRFIIFRLADWVVNIRETAKTALSRYFQPVFIDEFLRQISLIDWLLKIERTDLTDLHREIYQYIFSFELNESFYQKLNRFDDKTKVIYVRNYLKFKQVSREIFELLADEKLFLIKIELLKHIEKLGEENQKLFIRRFLQDRSAKVRVYAIYSTKPFRNEFYDAILDSIFDISASVRELSRFILRESSIDFAELYRQRLKEDENSVSAILGLAEVGTQDDLPLFESYIQKPNVKIKVACLTALNELNKGIAKRYALEFLSHSSAKVRNKSAEIIASMFDEEVLEKARNVYQNGSVEQKKTVLKMFSQIGGWKIVGDFIIALSDADENIRNMGWLNLEKWRRNQLFTRPLAEDLARINRLYEELNRTKPELTSSHERFWAELPFYLRR